MSLWSRRALLQAPLLLGAAPALAQEDKKGKPPGLAAKELGVSTDVKKPHSHDQNELAKSIGRDVVCLCGTCPKRLITDCECGWAVRNQNAILNAVVEGKTRDDIVSAYRRVYGDQVLALLPNEGFATTAWALPYAVGAAGLIASIFVGLRFMRKDPVEEDAAAPVPEITDDADARAELERELEELE